MTSNVLILFDIDGTLMIPGDRAHATALLEAFRTVFSLEPDLEGVQLAGMLDAQITRQLLAKHDVDYRSVLTEVAQVMDIMGDLYSSAIGSNSLVDRRLPGVVESVEAVKELEFQIGTLTGNARRVAEVKLGAAELGELTQVGGFGDRVVNRSDLVFDALETLKQRTNMTIPAAQVVLVGDTPQDIDAARNSGARVVAVTTGRYDEVQLRQSGADLVLPDLTDPFRFTAAVQRALEQPVRPDGSEWSRK